jgi:hypothetical protein
MISIGGRLVREEGVFDDLLQVSARGLAVKFGGLIKPLRNTVFDGSFQQHSHADKAKGSTPGVKTIQPVNRS